MENNTLKILAIDDNQDNLTSVKALIKEPFPHALVLTATEAGKGIELAQAANPDVILLDVVMPDIDGFEACQQLKANPLTRSIPVVFLTALKGDKEARIRALEVGAEAFLSKPIDEVELTAQIRAMQKIKASSTREHAEKEDLNELVAARTRELGLAHMAALNLLEDLRRENEARLESETHLRLLFENLPSGVVVHAADTAVRFANPEALRLLGLTLEQMQGKCATDPVWCFLREDGGSLPLEDYPVNRLRTSGKPFSGQIIGIRLPGQAESNWVQCSAYPQLDASGQLSQVIVAFTDITERKQAEAALQRSDALQRKMISNIGDVIVIIDNNGINRYKSENIERFFGWKPEEVIGESALANVHPDDVDAAQAFMIALLKTPNATATIQVRYRCKNGSYKWISFTGCNLLHDPDIHGILGNYKDITEHKLADDYRTMSVDIMQILNEQGDLSDAIQRIIATCKTRIGLDSVGLRLQEGEDFPYYAQDGFSKEFLLKENTLLERGEEGGLCRDKDGRVSLKCTCGLVISGKTEAAGQLCTRGGSFWTNDSCQLIDKPGDQDTRLHPRKTCIHHGYASMALVPIRTKDNIVGLLHLCERRKGRFTLETVELLEGIASHIGEALMRKQAEEEREQMQAQLIQSQKLESIGTLASGVAHEINNPIMGIMGYAQLLLDHLGPDSPVSEYALEIGKETERIALIAKNLLGFARQESETHLSPARLCDIIASTLSLITSVMRHDQIALEVNVPADLPRITCRSQQIQQVVMNLLTNARDAVNQKYPKPDANKIIRLSAALGRRNAKGVDCVRLTVEDHGVGISEDLRTRIFDPFFTTKPRDKGTGLGLSISYGIVTEHGGELSIESEFGHWTRVHMDLPLNVEAELGLEKEEHE